MKGHLDLYQLSRGLTWTIDRRDPRLGSTVDRKVNALLNWGYAAKIDRSMRHAENLSK